MTESLTITIKGNTAYFTGIIPLEIIQDCTSYYSPGYKFVQSYKKGYWDGRVKIYNAKKNTCPAGLVETIVSTLKKEKPALRIQIVDTREDNVPGSAQNGFSLVGVDFGVGKYSYQVRAAEAAVLKKRGILKCAVNSGKTEVACAVTKHLTVPTLFLVTSVDLLSQARDRFAKRLGLSKDDVGIIGDSKCEIRQWVNVATVDTLHSRMKDPDIQRVMNSCQLLFIDECHHSASETSFSVLEKIPAYWRIGLSGTPLNRGDGADLRLIAQTGEIIYEVTNKQLIDLGVSARPHIEFVRVDLPKIPRKTPWQTVEKLGITENTVFNDLVVEKTVALVKQGFKTVVLIDKIAHGVLLEEMLSKRIKNVQFIKGEDDSEVRAKAIEDFTKGKINCMISSRILDEGVDCPAIDAIVFAGGGKCLGDEVPVLLYDGSIKFAKDIKVGDLLMGPDSLPRKVLEVENGQDFMYRITPKDKGMSWTCNSNHILTVGKYLGRNRPLEILDVPLEHFIDENKSQFYSINVPFNFNRPTSTPVDPYFLGVWYGDGHKALKNGSLVHVALTKPDLEIKELAEKIAKDYGLEVRTTLSNGCPTYHLHVNRGGGNQNPLLNAVREIVGDLTKLPDAYLKGSYDVRMQFLAGYLDSDGYLHNNTSYEIVQKNKEFAMGICFLANSLGFRSTFNPKIVDGKLYYRVTIKGDCDKIPVRIPRKKARGKLKNSSNRTRFTVSSLGIGNYSGFLVDQDGRFLLGDGTVTHNSIIRSLQRLGRGMRIRSGKDKVFVVDFINGCHKFLLDHSMERYKTYKNENAFVITVTE